MISNRLIALALVAALVQAWTLSFRLAAAAGDAAEKPPPLSGEDTPQQFAWYCKADEEPAWSARDQTVLQLSLPDASLSGEF